MNLTFRKLALLEKEFIEKEEAARIEGYYTSPVNKEFKEKITNLLDKIRYCY